jgi:hypothetical protein
MAQEINPLAITEYQFADDLVGACSFGSGNSDHAFW